MSSDRCAINVVYNQVLMRGFCWSLTSFNVNRFRLAFALKEQNKTFPWLRFWPFQTGPFRWNVPRRQTEAQSARREPGATRVEPCPFAVPPGYLWLPQTPFAVLGSPVLGTLAGGSSSSRPARLPLPLPPGMRAQAGRVRYETVCLKPLPPPRMSPCRSDAFYKVPSKEDFERFISF